MNSNSIPIKKTIEIPKMTLSVNFDDIFDKKYSKYISDFYSTIKNSVGEDKLYLFCNNIKSLKINNKNKLFYDIWFLLSGTEGTYYTSENEMKFSLKYRINSSLMPHVINHELLHMSSSIYDCINDYDYVGFSQECACGVIGVGLDEGYTEHLNKVVFNEPFKHSTYRYFEFVSSLIEKIVGKEEMISLYFSANLYDLASLLCKYTSYYNVLEFFSLSDYLFIDGYSDIFIKKIRDAYYRINEILLEIYANKLKRDILMGYILESDAINMYYYFSNELYQISDFTKLLNKDILNQNIITNTFSGIRTLKK